jgi:hypothetical protein
MCRCFPSFSAPCGGQTPAVVLAVLLVAIAAPVAVAGAATGQFTALTYNVAGLPVGVSGSEPDINTPLISPLLNDYDLVLVQESWTNPDPPIEGSEFFNEILVSQVTHPYLSVPAPPPLGGDPRRPEAQVADGLNRMSRFPFGAVIREMWTTCHGGGPDQEVGTADCLSQKGFSVARTTFAPGIEIDVYNLHAQAGGRNPDATAVRRQNYDQLAEFILTHSDGQAIITGGDFNLRRTRPDDDEILDWFLERTGLVDVCEVVDCGMDDDEIDRFLFRSGGGITLEPLTHRFEREKFQRDDGERLSDHDPLAVTFRWTGVVGDEESARVCGPRRSCPAAPAGPAQTD